MGQKGLVLLRKKGKIFDFITVGISEQQGFDKAIFLNKIFFF